MADIAYDLAANAASARYEDLSQETVEITKKFILDTLATTIAGSTADGCKNVVDQVVEWGGKPQSSLQVYGGKVPAPEAALANAMMAHALDFDDTHDIAALHANVSVMPATLAVAEQIGRVSGKDYITAVAVGVDIMCRLGLGVLPGPLRWILSSTAGHFGAAAACGKILGLDAAKIQHAMGIVYSQCGGNAQSIADGGLVKRMQPAFAARAGVTSALLAQRGITGAKNIFEGKFGFYPLYYNGKYDRSKIVDGLGKIFTGKDLSVKLYPCCRFTHASIDAALEIVKQHDIQPDQISEVVAHTALSCFEQVGKPFEIRDSPQVDAQFSIPYTVSIALTRKKAPFIDDFAAERIVKDKQLQAMAQKVVVKPDQQAVNMGFTPLLLEVKMKDGKTYSQSTDILRGDPRKPATMSDIEQKLRSCAAFAAKPVAAKKIDKLVAAVTKLETVTDVAGALIV